MSDQRRFANAGTVAMLAVVSMFAECAIIRWFLLPGPGRWMALPAHLLVTGGLALWIVKSLWPTVTSGCRCCLHWEPRFSGQLAWRRPHDCGARRLVLPQEPLFREWYRSLFPDSDTDPSQELLERIAAADSESGPSVTAFADILAFGSLAQKQALIALISRQFQPAFGPVLKKALTDGHSAVRVQAASAMNKIENQFFEQVLALSRAVSERPHEAATLRRWRATMTLIPSADSRLEARGGEPGAGPCGIPRVPHPLPGDAKARFAVTRLLLRSKKYLDAANWLEESLRLGSPSLKLSCGTWRAFSSRALRGITCRGRPPPHGICQPRRIPGRRCRDSQAMGRLRAPGDSGGSSTGMTGSEQVDVCLVLEAPTVCFRRSVNLDARSDLSSPPPPLLFDVPARRRRGHEAALQRPGERCRNDHVIVGRLPEASRAHARGWNSSPAWKLRCSVCSEMGLDEIASIVSLISGFRSRVGCELLLNSPAAWDLLLRMYRTTYGESSFWTISGRGGHPRWPVLGVVGGPAAGKGLPCRVDRLRRPVRRTRAPRDRPAGAVDRARHLHQ